MLNTADTQGIYLNVPMTDWMFLKELIRKYGWQAETRETWGLSRVPKSRVSCQKNMKSNFEQLLIQVSHVKEHPYRMLENNTLMFNRTQFPTGTLGLHH